MGFAVKQSNPWEEFHGLARGGRPEGDSGGAHPGCHQPGLEKPRDEGRFRRDLYERLNQIERQFYEKALKAAAGNRESVGNTPFRFDKRDGEPCIGSIGRSLQVGSFPDLRFLRRLLFRCLRFYPRPLARRPDQSAKG